MTRDLPIYYRNEGYVGAMLEDCLKRKPENVYCVRIDLRHGTGTHQVQFFARGDFRPDIVEAVQALLHEDGHQKKFRMDWQRKVMGTGVIHYDFQGRGAALGIGVYSVTRVAEIAENSYVKNPRWDEDGRMILDRKDFLVEFRGSIADQALNMAKSCFSSAARIPQPPDDASLQKMLDEAGESFDRYQAVPVDSLMVTKDYIFPYVVARKEHDELRWTHDCAKHTGYSEDGPRIATADPCVHLTGIDKACAPHMFKNPVFRANFGFSFDYVNSTTLLDKADEKGYVRRIVDSMGDFKTIWVQSPPRDVDKGFTQPNGNYWFPARDELIAMAEKRLKIG
jgi:hypothetical protein